MPYTVEDFKRDQANQPVPEYWVEEVFQKVRSERLIGHLDLERFEQDLRSLDSNERKQLQDRFKKFNDLLSKSDDGISGEAG